MNGNIFVIYLIFLKIATAQEGPVLELPSGRILGRQAVTYANTPYFSFQKIPYAMPPVGPLRFRAPQRAQNWEGVLDATVLDVSCYQLQSDSPTDSEDCLIVNVYTPQLPTENQTVSLPVMFWIYGGIFLFGSTFTNFPDLFVDNGVILVTINYRMGFFGFASTEDEVIPGNNGLKDQRLALQWTHEFIHLFGGDPNQITIFGESAGSVSVSYQLLNQDSNGLFRAAIMQSGSFLAPWTLQRRARTIAFGTAAEVGFSSSNDSYALLEFLQSLPADVVDYAAEQYLRRFNANTTWYDDFSHGVLYGPVIEVNNPDAFLTRKMYGLLQSGNILKVPIMLGFNSEEMITFFQDPNGVQPVLNGFDADPGQIVPEDMQITDPQEHAQMAQSIRDIYTGGQPWGNRLGDGIRYLSTNFFTRAPTKQAELHSAFAPTYFYQFSYDGPRGGITVQYDGAERVGHAEDVAYLFCSGYGCSFDGYPESDRLNSQRMIKLWTDFAKYMNPTPAPVELLQYIIWPALSVADGNFLCLDINENLAIVNHPKGSVFAAWQGLYNSLNFTDFDTW